jgi:hypothetical protein
VVVVWQVLVDASQVWPGPQSRTSAQPGTQLPDEPQMRPMGQSALDWQLAGGFVHWPAMQALPAVHSYFEWQRPPPSAGPPSAAGRLQIPRSQVRPSVLYGETLQSAFVVHGEQLPLMQISPSLLATQSDVVWQPVIGRHAPARQDSPEGQGFAREQTSQTARAGSQS